MKNQIINILKNKKEYLSGEEISQRFDISRAAIWKNIEELRKEGYKIAATPHLGYKLESVPDMLLPREIAYELNTQIIGHKVFYFDEIDSTMDYAFKLGIDGEKEGAVVCAETQTKGRGRLGRSWQSPKTKGIYASLLLRPLIPITDAAKLNLLTAVAVCEAVYKTTGILTKIKWPNDLLIGEKKVAGFLTEMSAEMDRLKFVVIGMGINVNTSGRMLLPTAISLKQAGAKDYERVVIFKEILRSMERWYLLIQKEGFSLVMKRWKELSSTLGSRVRLVDQSGIIEGEAVDVDEFGGLMIKNDRGIVVKRMSGDVVEI